MPDETPVTMPVEELTVAIEVLLLVQWPPDVESDRAVVAPTQTLVIPLMPCTDIEPETVTTV